MTFGKKQKIMNFKKSNKKYKNSILIYTNEKTYKRQEITINKSI